MHEVTFRPGDLVAWKDPDQEMVDGQPALYLVVSIDGAPGTPAELYQARALVPLEWTQTWGDIVIAPVGCPIDQDDWLYCDGEDLRLVSRASDEDVRP